MSGTHPLLAQAVVLHQQGDLAAAEALYRRVLATTPREPDALHLLGVLLAQRGQPVDAIPLIRAAIAEAPRDAVFHANLGRAHKSAGQSDTALAIFDRAIALGAIDPGVFNDRGNLLLDLGRPAEALDSFDQAIALRPDYAEAHGNRGNALRALGRGTEALASYDQALALTPAFADTLSNRGTLLQELERPEDALASFDRALTLRPDHLDALTNRGVALRMLGQHQAALASYERALALRPTHPLARNNRALCLLQRGDMVQGWVEHEWRWWSTPRFADRPGWPDAPPWLGEVPLAGKTILLHAEQGFGDTLQFCRYVAPVAQAGARVVLAVPRALARLMGTLEGADRIICADDKVPRFDLHCPLMSLPLALGTTLETIPARVPYLMADPLSVAAWQQRVSALPGLRVGLCWAGNPRLGDPVASAIDRRRSIALGQYGGLAEVPGISFVSLQKDAAGRPASALPAGMVLHDWTGELADFADTAALVQALDLVITVDTAVAHLAGALGKPVWVLNRFDACWRWLLGRTDSPWYPTARLFRQPAPGDWDAVMRDVAVALGVIADAHGCPAR